MYLSKIFTVTGGQSTYRLRRVQPPEHKTKEAPEEIKTILESCVTEAELLDFFFTTDYPVNEAFILLFEQRIQKLQSQSL